MTLSCSLFGSLRPHAERLHTCRRGRRQSASASKPLPTGTVAVHLQGRGSQAAGLGLGPFGYNGHGHGLKPNEPGMAQECGECAERQSYVLRDSILS